MRISYTLGRITKGVAKAALPVGKWATQQAANITSEFVRGMSEQPTAIATDESYRNAVRDESNNEVPSNIDDELKQELSSEPVQPELPGMDTEPQTVQNQS
tara:strand:+ start:730 stop:1032 length:303 start_codon:yes stop_codon:yes gene_type:complete